MNIRFEKTDYEEKPYVGHHDSPFEVSVSLFSSFASARLTRRQLALLHSQIGTLLNTNDKPKYTVGNHSDIFVELEVEEERCD